MHLESTAYGRAWECDRRQGISWCPGAIQIADLLTAHQTLREDLAHDWSLRPEPVEDLHARFTEALPGLREAILASPPIYLQVVRRLLAKSESDNVVRLAPRRAP
jgi:hypothetical protein